MRSRWPLACAQHHWTSLWASSISWGQASYCVVCSKPTASARSCSTVRQELEKQRLRGCWQAKAAASSADNFLAKGEVAIEPYYSFVIDELCVGCRVCIAMCPYTAITFDEDRKISVIDSFKCKGGGTCMITCSNNAIDQNHFTRDQILSELRAIEFKPQEKTTQ